MPRSRYPDNRRIAAFQRELLQSVRSVPGVQSAGLATYLPLSGNDNGWAFFIEGRPPLPVGVFNTAKYRPASPGYFEAIGIPLLQGRAFTFPDTQEAPWVVMINQSMARAYWGQQDPVGQRLRFNNEVWRTVVGVVGDVLHEGLDGAASPEMYMPFTQAANTENGPTIVVRPQSTQQRWRQMCAAPFPQSIARCLLIRSRRWNSLFPFRWRSLVSEPSYWRRSRSLLS